MIVEARSAREAVELVRREVYTLRRVPLLIKRVSDTEWKVTAK